MLLESMDGMASRRGLLTGLGGLGAAAAVSPALAATPGGPHNPNIRPLGQQDPRENVYAFSKIWGTLGPKAVKSGYYGVQYAVIGSKRAIPLFGYYGCGNIRNVLRPDGTARVFGKECGYFTDLATGEIIDYWDNPWTGERVEVFPFLNDAYRRTITLEQPILKIGDSETIDSNMGDGVRDKGQPFLLPWNTVGDQYLLTRDYAHEYTNPVTPEGWPKASTGVRANPSEHFCLFTPRAEVDDRSLETARYHGGFTRQGPWWPWMRMGQSGVDGVLFGRMHSYKITGTEEDIPKVVLKRLERERPDLLEEPEDGPDVGVRGTLEAFAEEVPPETPGYVSAYAEQYKKDQAARQRQQRK